MTALSRARAVQPYNVVKDFEAALCDYTGAPYAVTVTSCTMALLLAVAWHLRSPFGFVRGPHDEKLISIPKRTYVSVPMSIIHAGGRPVFRDEEWLGAYQLKPLPVWDSARYFTSGLYRGEMAGSSPFFRMTRDCAGQFVCVSFHASKILGDTQGGAILHDNPEADAWFRRMRFDGRTEGVAPKDDHFREVGYHCYLSPDVAARLLLKLSVLPRHNEPLPNDPYPDLSKVEAFR
jgi:dTDP-4-amino-4,6-dideoxygalactose transaminase